MNYIILIISYYNNLSFIDIIIIIIIKFFIILLTRLTLTNHVIVIYPFHAGPCQCTGRRVYLRCLTQALGN